MKQVRSIVDSFNYAIEGLVYATRTQRNMRIHLITSLCILTACFFYKLSKAEILVLSITITLVLFAELINTAIEATVDILTNNFHPLAKIAKNTAAGAVLVTAINAIFVGYIIFWDKLKKLSFQLVNIIKESDTYLVFIVLILICMIILFLKAVIGEGTPLRGGMPSGHASISFAIATRISLIAKNESVILLSFILAIIVAQSRVDSKVHSVWEVIVGAIVGILITVIIFKVFTY